MATLQKIRTRAGVLVAIVIGFSLLAFILGDMLSAGSSIFRGNQMQIGEVNGKSIQYPDYQQRLIEAEEMYKMNSGQKQLDENARAQLREQTWQQMVNESVMGDVYKDLGLNVSSDEMFDMLQGTNLHPIIQQIFRNQQTGQVDRSAVISFLKNLESGNVDPEQKDYWLYLEKQIQKDRIQSKYATMVGKGLYATKNQAQDYIKSGDKVIDFNYVALNTDLVKEDEITISEKDLKDYYKKNESQYKQKAGRKIEYITYDVVPSKKDKIESEGWINDIKTEFADTENNIQFINTNSDVNYNDTWYAKDQLPENIATWIFENSAAENSTYGPYADENSFTIAKLLKVEMQPDSIKARHILLQPKTEAEAANLQQVADSLKAELEKGANFATLARQYSADKGSAAKGGDLGWFGRGQMVKPFENTAFGLKTNKIGVVTSQFGIHIIQTMAKGRESKKAQVGFLTHNVIASSETYQNTYAKASKFVADNNSYKDFKATVSADEQLTKKIANLQINDITIPGFNNTRQLVRSAFDSKVGEIVKDTKGARIFEIDDSFVVAVVTSANEEGIAPFEEVKPNVEIAVEKQKKLALLEQKAAGALAADKTLQSVASKMGKPVETAENISFSSFSIPGVGIEPAVIGAATSLQFKELSQPIVGKNGVYVVQITSIEEKNNPSTPEDIQKNLSLNNSVRAYSQAYEAHKNHVEIDDSRSKFY